MASKASMLKQGANKTGKGLFAGMSRLDSREEEPSTDEKVTNVIEREDEKPEKVTKQVKMNDPISESIKESEDDEEIIEEEAPAMPEPEVEEEDESQKDQEISSAIESTEEEIKPIINKAIEAPKKAAKSAEKSSRYEKEKFLLLDIRGYRDYVEHMAKAANMSATKYIRNLIQQDMDKNLDIYEAHKALEEKLKGRVGN